MEEYLKLAEASGADGVAVFTWRHMQPYYDEVKAADSFRKFAAELEANTGSGPR